MKIDEIRLTDTGRKAYWAEYYQINKAKLRPKTAAYKRTRHKQNAEYIKKYRARIRLEVLSHYSNGEIKCGCCGEKHTEFLGIDHINGGGAKMRRELGHGNICTTLKSKGLPEGYQVLCHNCNMSIGFYGYCPHKGENQ